MAGIDPITFVRATPPFEAVPQKLFDEVAGAIDVIYAPQGQALVRAGGAPLEHVHVIRKGSVRLERAGAVVQVLEEGELFGYTSLITGRASFDVFVEEDLVAYRLPAPGFRRLMSDARFAGHFAKGLSARLRSSLEHSPVALFRADLALEVRTLLRRAPVWVDEGASTGEAALLMSTERISSVLVRTDPPAILTDRDLRNRVLAEGLGPETPVTAVASRPLLTIEDATPIHEAWARLLDAGVHHLPVTRDGAVVGVLTSTDLLRCSVAGPVAVLRRVERLPSRQSLPGYARTVAEMASALLAGGLDVLVIAGFVARLNDALVRRIVQLAQADLGPAPAPFAWVVFGSEGRMEQILLTDQDNALIYANGADQHRAWFQALAERVNEDLESAGFPRCPGGYMARHWMGSLGEWSRRFAGWIDEPSPQALLEASIFFDVRRVAGDLELEALDAVIAQAPQRSVFLRFLAKSAMHFRPPLGLMLRLRGDSSTVHLKLQGISPIVFLARCYGLEARPAARSTIDRIEAAGRRHLIGAEVWPVLVEAYRFLLGLRLRLQLRAVAEGGHAVNDVALSTLSSIERSRLKEAFRAIRRFQDGAEVHFRTDF